MYEFDSPTTTIEDIPYTVPPLGAVVPMSELVQPLSENPVLLTVRETVRLCAEWLVQEREAVAQPLPNFRHTWVIYPIGQASKPIMLQVQGDLPAIIFPAAIATPANNALVAAIKEFMTEQRLPVRVVSSLAGLRG